MLRIETSPISGSGSGFYVAKENLLDRKKNIGKPNAL